MIRSEPESPPPSSDPPPGLRVEKGAQHVETVGGPERERRRGCNRVEPAKLGVLFRLQQSGLAAETLREVDEADPVLVFGGDPLLADAEQAEPMRLDADFLAALTRCRRLRVFHEVDLAADETPMSRLGRPTATDEQHFAAPPEDETASDADKPERHAPVAISMKAGMSSPKPTGEGPRSSRRWRLSGPLPLPTRPRG